MVSLLSLRRWSRAVAVVLLIAAVPGLSHFATDDTACASAAESYHDQDERQQGLRAGAASHQQDHCAICHWTRSLRAPRPALALWIAHAPVSSPLFGRCESGHLAPVLEHTPARAPPVRL